MYAGVVERMHRRLAGASSVRHYGRVVALSDQVLHSVLPGVGQGELCALVQTGGAETGLAEVIGFDRDRALLSPLGELSGLSTSTLVRPLGRRHRVRVGAHLLGRVVDALGNPVGSGSDPAGKPRDGTCRDVLSPPVDAMDRPPIDRALETGVRAIDGLATLGVGQRVGVFSAAGVGKSTLLGMITRSSTAEVVVVALIGERAREVREFLERGVPEGIRSRTVFVVATADQPAMLRVRAAHVATAIAEHFREAGQDVLLVMDSITRFARALREVALAAGESAARRGFPGSVFAALPRLLERAGCAQQGSITGIYSVLVEGDDPNEPIADEVRSLVDAHLFLSRELAASGHYPAIDVLESRSRIMDQLVSADQVTAATTMRALLARYRDVELLLQVNEYERGQDAVADRAIERRADILRFLQQATADASAWPDTLSKLHAAIVSDDST